MLIWDGEERLKNRERLPPVGFGSRLTPFRSWHSPMPLSPISPLSTPHPPFQPIPPRHHLTILPMTSGIRLSSLARFSGQNYARRTQKSRRKSLKLNETERNSGGKGKVSHKGTKLTKVRSEKNSFERKEEKLLFPLSIVHIPVLCVRDVSILSPPVRRAW